MRATPVLWSVDEGLQASGLMDLDTRHAIIRRDMSRQSLVVAVWQTVGEALPDISGVLRFLGTH